MEITITARHCSITDALRERAGLIEEKLRRQLTRAFDRSRRGGPTIAFES